MKTVSLQLSQQLKDNGYPQEGYFVWFDMDGEYKVVEKLPAMPNLDWYASPTADEILDQLPKIVKKHGRDIYIIAQGYSNMVNGDNGHYWFSYKHTYKNDFLMAVISDSVLADAAAKMWLYLNKEGLL